MTDFDVIVVGGGPAGCIAAYESAKAGLKTIILEKDRDIGYPVRCAEAIGEDGLRKFMETDPQWVAATIKYAQLHSPEGTAIRLDLPIENGLILHRRLFDFALAQRAAEAGSEVQTKAYVDGLIISDDQVKGVNYQYFGEKRSLTAKIVIGADGVESRVGRMAGLRTALKLSDTGSGYQVSVANVDVEQDVIDFYFGSKLAPSGYLWIFPKGEGMANIGLGVVGKGVKDVLAKDLLDKFLADRFPKAAVLTAVAGGIPLAKTLKKISTNGLMLIGDAARMANPVSGGGIISGMVAGRIAGQVAAEAIRTGDLSEKGLKAFPARWHKEVGRDYAIAHRISNSIRDVTDDQFNKMARELKDLPPEKLHIRKVFATAAKHKPKILLDITRAFAHL
ncbi:MAG: NAD(P)/FAD-dependent oxidoreductase [Candidatus Marinimicrobia bacterium]|nr:NAD(P)/FAD-dependent oxidoreductase [Candidatus Neomarinimicrobiota bacterium]